MIAEEMMQKYSKLQEYWWILIPFASFLAYSMILSAKQLFHLWSKYGMIERQELGPLIMTAWSMGGFSGIGQVGPSKLYIHRDGIAVGFFTYGQHICWKIVKEVSRDRVLFFGGTWIASDDFYLGIQTSQYVHEKILAAWQESTKLLE